MAVKSYTLKINNILQGGETCINPTITWDEPECVGITCIISDTEITIQVDDACVNKCVDVIIDCDDCSQCPPVKKTICICDSVDDCGDCESCVDNVCVSDCNEGEICVNDECVDCVDDSDCVCNQICENGNCQCPVDKPFQDENGCCKDCLTDADCPPCFRCGPDGCQPIVCTEGECDPSDNICKECLESSDCTGANECCVDNQCECCSGYYRNPENGECEVEKECIYDTDCEECQICVDGECEDIVCPPGTECVDGDCIPTCDCVLLDCKGNKVCRETTPGNCHCYDCEGNCDFNEDCGEGCYCDNGVCKKNPCFDTCISGADCGEGCGCYQGECVPCDSLPCEPDCQFAFGCACPEGSTCEEVKGRCREENVNLEWIYVSGTPGEQTDPGAPALVGSCNVTALGITTGTGGPTPLGFYYEHQFSFTVNNPSSSGGSWYYSAQAGSEVFVGGGSSVTVRQSQSPLNNNLFGFRMIYKDNDGRILTFQATFNQTDLQAPNTWNCSVIDSTGLSPTYEGGTSGYWKLVSTNSNFKFVDAVPESFMSFSSSGTPINITFTKLNDYELRAFITGCGEWKGEFDMFCDNIIVRAKTDIFVVDEDSCCDASDPGCGGSGGPCEEVTITTIELLKFPLFDPSTNSFTVMVDLNSISFEQLYRMNPLCWGTSQNTNGFNDIVFGGVFGQSQSDLYKNVTFTNGGCITLGKNCEMFIGVCEKGEGELCFDKCDDFENYVWIENDSFGGDPLVKLVKGYPAVDVSSSAVYTWTVNGSSYGGLTVIGRTFDIETVSVDLTALVTANPTANTTINLNVLDGDCDGDGNVNISVPEVPCDPNPVEALSPTATYNCSTGVALSHSSLQYIFTSGYIGNVTEGQKLDPATYDISVTDGECFFDIQLVVPQCYRCDSGGNCVASSLGNNTGPYNENTCGGGCDTCEFRNIQISFDNSDTYCTDGTLDFSATSNGGGAPNEYLYRIETSIQTIYATNGGQVGSELDEGTPAIFNLSDLINGGLQNPYILYVTDQDNCVKTYSFNIDCFVEPKCNQSIKCYEMQSPVDVVDINGGNAGRIVSLIVATEDGGIAELLGSNIDASNQFDTYYDLVGDDYQDLENDIAVWSELCADETSIGVPPTLDVTVIGNTISVKFDDSVIQPISIVIEDSTGSNQIRGFGNCTTNNQCGLLYANNAAGDIYALTIDGGVVTNQEMVCSSLNRYGDIAMTDNGILYGVFGTAVDRIDNIGEGCSPVTIGNLAATTNSAVFLDSTTLLTVTRQGAQQRVEFWLFDILTGVSTLFGTILDTAANVWNPAGDLAVIGNNIYATMRNSGTNAGGSSNVVDLVQISFTPGPVFGSATRLGPLPGNMMFGLAVVEGNLYAANGIDILQVNTSNPASSSIIYQIQGSSSGIDGLASIEDPGNPCN